MANKQAIAGSNRYAAAIAIVTFLIFVAAGIRYGPSPVVGDELDYYATLYGWGTFQSPTLTEPVVNAVRAAFPGRPAHEPHMLRAVNGTYDAQHFWFMSFLDAPFFRLCKATGLDWKHSFTFLNALVFALAAGVTYKAFRLTGVVVLFAGTVLSPLLPYMNKAHAEHYTVCLLMVAVLCVQQGRLPAAALALSAISAQVSAFSPLAVLVLLFFILRTGVRRLRKFEWALIGACGCLLALQPVWSLWRHHKINVLIGAGDVWLDMATPKRMAEMLIDPDIGLFFTWPLCPVIALLVANGIQKNLSVLLTHKRFWTFAILAVPFLSFIGAQQLNYTTAATRYSLWFIPLGLVGFLVILTSASYVPRWRTFTVVNVTLFLLAAALNGYYLIAIRGVSPSLTRSPLAEAWYRLLPGVYDPEEQTFADMALHVQAVSGRALYLTSRFPVEGLPDRGIWAMSNKACNKLLVLAYAFSSSVVQPRSPLGCDVSVDARQLLQYVRQTGGPPMRDRFVTVPSNELLRMRSLNSNASEPPIVNRPPRVDAIEATQVAESEVVYTFQLSDPNGWQDLKLAYFLIRGAGDSAAGCFIKYSAPNHMMAIRLPDGTMSNYVVPGQSKKFFPGEPDVLHGQGCTVEARRSLVSAQGETMTFSIVVHLESALLKGPSLVAASVEDLDRVASAWLTVAQPRFDPNQRPPDPDEKLPVLSADVAYTGTKKVAIVWLLVKDTLDTKDACYITYEVPAKQLFLTPDSGDSTKAGKVRLASADVLKNSQCTLYARGSTVVMEPNRIKLRLHAERKPAFDNIKRIWAAVQYEDGTTTHWQEVGFWH